MVCKPTEVTAPCVAVHSTCNITVPRLLDFCSYLSNNTIFLASFPGLHTTFVTCNMKSMKLYWCPPYSPTARPVSSEVWHLSMLLHQILRFSPFNTISLAVFNRLIDSPLQVLLAHIQLSSLYLTYYSCDKMYQALPFGPPLIDNTLLQSLSKISVNSIVAIPAYLCCSVQESTQGKVM